MDQQTATALAQRIADSPMARPLFQRAASIAFKDDPKTVVVFVLTAEGGLSLEQRWADDPSLNDVTAMLTCEPEDLQEIAAGRQPRNPPDITGKDATLAQQVLLVLGVEGVTQTGGGAVGGGTSSLEMSRDMVYDSQLGGDRQIFSPFNAREPGPFDCRHWRIEAGITGEGHHFAVTAGLSDPATAIPAPQSDPANLSGLGHELVMLCDPATAAGQWHVGILAMMLREYGSSDRPFGNPDWIDYQRPMVQGGTVEGFIVHESTWLESPFALANGKQARFFALVGLTRVELDVLNTQKEPRRVLRLLEQQIGNVEIIDAFRAPVQVW